MPNTNKSHTSVLLEPAIQALNIKPAGTYIDATFGRGGHSQLILKHLGPKGRLIAIDQDPQAIEYANQTPLFSKDHRFEIIHANFSQLEQICTKLQLTNKIDGILFDFGVSSPQLDQAERGFSFQKDGPLDMRMDPTTGISAAQLLQDKTSSELTKIFYIYGEERFAKKIADKIKLNINNNTHIETTLELADLIKATIPRKFHQPHKHPATKCFQALRIALNNELEVIEQILTQLPNIIAPQGRVAFISFHSLEDRIIKKFIQKELNPCQIPKEIPILDKDIKKHQQWEWITKRQRASQLECQDNPRARSATLRVIEKIGLLK